jgi:hypothetical protein
LKIPPGAGAFRWPHCVHYLTVPISLSCHTYAQLVVRVQARNLVTDCNKKG